MHKYISGLPTCAWYLHGSPAPSCCQELLPDAVSNWKIKKSHLFRSIRGRHDQNNTHIHGGMTMGPPLVSAPGLKDVVDMRVVSAWLSCIQLLLRVVPRCCEQLENKSFTSIQIYSDVPHTHRGRVKQQLNI